VPLLRRPRDGCGVHASPSSIAMLAVDCSSRAGPLLSPGANYLSYLFDSLSKTKSTREFANVR
jgi:hypothetical protein